MQKNFTLVEIYLNEKKILLFYISIFIISCLFGCGKNHIHNYVESIIEPTCEEEGYTLYVCQSCGYSYTDNYVDEKGHYWDNASIIKEPTCLEDGSVKYNCMNCDEVKYDIIEKSGHNIIDDEEVEPTFTSDGLTKGSHCSTCGEIIVPQEIIPKLEYTDYAYKVSFEYDKEVAYIEVFNNQNMSRDGEISDVCYSRDSSTGRPINDGNGQINFIVHCKEEYVVDSIEVEGQYKNVKDSIEIGVNNGYRITKISSDLTIKINFSNIDKLANSKMMFQFASNVDEGAAHFSWKERFNLKKINVIVSFDNQNQEYTITNETNWSYSMKENTTYRMEFIPFYNDYITGEHIITTASNYPSSYQINNVNRVEITTKNYVIPTCDYVLPPEGCIGAAITNNQYVDSIVRLYNSSNDLVYDSSNYNSNSDEYSGSKIRIRGNTSAYPIKKPYKIKLNNEFDLLSDFLGRESNQYLDKEWLLLASGNSLYNMVGRTVAETISDSWSPAYSYVTLFINGDFQGLYILSESVNENRTNISSDGFLIEYDPYWWNEDVSFGTYLFPEGFTFNYTFKYPEDISKESDEYRFIQGYVSEFEKKLLDHDSSIKDYIDINSFAEWLLIHDILVTKDNAGSNMFYIMNESSSKLKMGPTWDFDSICSQAYSLAPIRYANWAYFYYLLNKQEFLEAYRNIFNSKIDKVLSNLEEKLNSINEEDYDTMIDLDNKRWVMWSTHFSDQKNYILSFFNEHINYMKTVIS